MPLMPLAYAIIVNQLRKLSHPQKNFLYLAFIIYIRRRVADNIFSVMQIENKNAPEETAGKSLQIFKHKRDMPWNLREKHKCFRSQKLLFNFSALYFSL